MGTAQQVFWRHGFHASSIEELSRATGLGQSSLYNAFGSKDGLFAECLGVYLDEAQGRLAGILDDTTRDAVGRIEALLLAIASDEIERSAHGGPRGCLAVNTVAEFADDPDATATIERVGRDTRERLELLASALRIGQAAGEITTDVSADGLAAYVNAAIAGLRISSQGGASPETIHEIVSATMRALRPA
ncbi:TetR/AcrR family transcriptional regulator [Microbacterium sp. nov. GSS16]|uniref:TetR/AcrR family transcriptional regulator n=1 Tax=Microbacterium sp. nov. GSS16 TaxID=3019890 RepID=UPI0023067446|nr:TetR/AcrR family transcriptional regulator [Microbacterium sp. nov. GSS16]WCD91488.1 TetR/AcrR family transcriptional regulator [Microbacterium sp. nov. GSS16]